MQTFLTKNVQKVVNFSRFNKKIIYKFIFTKDSYDKMVVIPHDNC